MRDQLIDLSLSCRVFDQKYKLKFKEYYACQLH